MRFVNSDSLMSSIRDSRLTSGFLGRPSAITSCFPGTYSTIGLNRMALINNRWQRSSASSIRFMFISGTNGRWSVSSLNTFSPTRYHRNFSQAQTFASISFSIWVYRCSAVVSVLDVKAFGLRTPSVDCISTAQQRFRNCLLGTHYRRFH